MIMPHRIAPMVATLLLTCACPVSKGEGEGEGEGEGVVDVGDCEVVSAGGASASFDDADGLFTVRQGEGFADFSGAVADGPPLRFHTEASRTGSCRLLRYQASTCTPACDVGTAQCINGTCQAYPDRLRAGDIDVVMDGVSHTVSVDGTDGYFASFTAPAQRQVALHAQGDEVGAFDLQACAVAAPEPTEDWSALMDARVDGADVTLSWSPHNPLARVSLRMTTGVGTHGGIAHAEIECDDVDTGSLTIPGAYLDEIYAEGWSCGECGDNTLFRYHRGDVDVDDVTVRLRVQSGTGFFHHPNF